MQYVAFHLKNYYLNGIFRYEINKDSYSKLTKIALLENKVLKTIEKKYTHSKNQKLRHCRSSNFKLYECAVFPKKNKNSQKKIIPNQKTIPKKSNKQTF